MSSGDHKAALNRLLQSEARDPVNMEKFLDTWIELTDLETAHPRLMLSGAVARNVNDALRSLDTSETWSVDAATLKAKLSSFPHPTMLVREDGVVLSINDAAFERLAIEPGQSIDAVPVATTSGRELSEDVRLALRNGRNRQGISFIPAVTAEEDRNLMLTVLAHEDPESKNRSAMVIAVDPVWSHEYKELFVDAFGLTETEAEVLLHFLNGQSTDQIAQARGRSPLTVRTQLQSILSKSGAPSQPELMRLAFAIGQFGRDVADVSEVVGHPNRRHFEIPAANGRKIEFYLSGDLSGTPVLYVPDITTVTFPAKVEAALKAAGVCVASVLRPGCGMTDQHPSKEKAVGIANDLETVSRQLDWRQPALMLHSSSCHHAPALVDILKDHISRLLLVSVPSPPPYLVEFAEASPWLISMARAKDTSPAMFRLIVTTGIMGWRALGTRRFAAIQLRSNALDVAELRTSDSLSEMDRAMRTYFSQPTDDICADARGIFSNWCVELADKGVEVRILQGDSDPTARIDAVHAILASHEGFGALSVIEGAGFMLPMTHPEVFSSWLSDGAKSSAGCHSVDVRD